MSACAFLGGAGFTREFAHRVVHLPTGGSAGLVGPRPQGRSHNLERLGSSGQTHGVVKVECVPPSPKPFWLKRVVLFCVCLWRSAVSDRDDGVGRRWRERRLRLSVQMALAKFKRHSSQRAWLARENCVRRPQLHAAETTSPGVRSGVPQETAPQEWLAAPASLGFLVRLLAAVLKGGPRGEERGAGEEEEGRAGEGAGKGEVRQPPRRFVESSIGDLHCSFLQRNALRGTSEDLCD